MEYMHSRDLEANLLDLESSIKTGPGIPEEEVKEITSQILEGLKIMHAEGFAHRDLKPKVQFVFVTYYAHTYLIFLRIRKLHLAI